MISFTRMVYTLILDTFRLDDNGINNKIRYLSLMFAVVVLSGCAAGQMFMAGYQPPQTIADLLREQNEIAANMAGKEGTITPDVQSDAPRELDFKKRTDEEISLSGYKGIIDPEEKSRLEASSLRMRNSYQARFTHKHLHDYAAQLTMNLMQHANQLPKDASIAVTSFVKLDYSLQNTTVIGNQLAEYTLLEMQQFGLNMVDFKLMPALEVTSKGDLIFARDIKKLANRQIMDYVLSATMIERQDGIFVNARIISLHNNRVAASGSVLIPHFIVSALRPQMTAY